MTKRLHILQHVAFEGPALIKEWAEIHNISISYTRFYENFTLPSIKEFDFMILLGGPMSVYETERYSWIKEELNFIREAIRYDKPVLGVCLGSQMIANALNAKVYPGKQKEIAWLPVSTKFTDNLQSPLSKIFPEEFTTFHWHGDTFDIPEGANRFASSEATPNQAFIYNKKVIALQFHMETTSDSLNELIKHCGEEIENAGPYIQKAEYILANHKRYVLQNKSILFNLLDYQISQA